MSTWKGCWATIYFLPEMTTCCQESRGQKADDEIHTSSTPGNRATLSSCWGSSDRWVGTPFRSWICTKILVLIDFFSKIKAVCVCRMFTPKNACQHGRWLFFSLPLVLAQDQPQKSVIFSCFDWYTPWNDSSHLPGGHSNRKVVFQPSIFRCELLVSGRVLPWCFWCLQMILPSVLRPLDLRRKAPSSLRLGVHLWDDPIWHWRTLYLNWVVNKKPRELRD